MIMVSSVRGPGVLKVSVAVVVTVAKGYDLSYVWRKQGQAERTIGGYYINWAAQGLCAVPCHHTGGGITGPAPEFCGSQSCLLRSDLSRL